MGFIRFLEITGHLGKEAVCGNPHIYSKAKLFPDLTADIPCKIHRIRHITYIHVSLINRCLLYNLCVTFQYPNKLTRAFPIELEI